MAAFCGGIEPYWRWRAEPWAGKSALLASFALNPPADVVVAAFFVTVRDAAQNDSAAFIMTITGQLEELLGDEYLAWQGTGNDRTRYLLLLKEAARRFQANGKRLVLVVDGLDEDRGAERGQPSIASLLPKHGEYGLKVVVSGRPNPGIPADVPEDHPLRQPRFTHRLREYSGAQRLRDTARLELHALLGGTELERDLLGFITAARGGLSEDDLAELTQLPPFKINSVLNSATGRVFATRSALEADDADPVYLLAHETLQDEAEREFGNRHLAEYRNRLHTLADDFRLRGWPPNTPQYLLTGYFAMTRDTGDILRMIDCATDEARHDLMLGLSGGDSAALTEIGLAQETILSQQNPDLAAMARLAFHHGELATRNIGIPVALPAVWAALGNANRGEALADSLMPAARKAEALSNIARTLATARQYARAVQVAEHAERVIQTLAVSSARATACAEVAVALAAVGARERAEGLLESIADIRMRERARNRIVAAYAATGLHVQALALTRLIADAARESHNMAEAALSPAENHLSDYKELLSKDRDTLSRSIAACLQSAEELSSAMEDSITLGVEPSAVEVIEEIADNVRRYRMWMPRDEGRSFARLASVLGGAGLQAAAINLLDKKEEKAEAGDPEKSAAALAETAAAFAACGFYERAESTARSIPDLRHQSEALTRIAAAAATAGLDEKASELARDAEAAARSIISAEGRSDDLCVVAVALAGSGFPVQAASLAYKGAATARLLAEPKWRPSALARSAWALASAGQQEQAEQLADEAKATAALIPEEDREFWSAWMTIPLAQAGFYDKAEDLARSICHQSWPKRTPVPSYEYQAWALAKISAAAVGAGRRTTAARLAADAATLLRVADSDRSYFTYAQAATVRALAASGLHVRAASLAALIADKADQAEAYAGMAETLMISGSRERAVQFAGQAETSASEEEDRESRVRAMAEAAESLASAGLYERAEALASSIDDSKQKASALAGIAAQMASSGLYERADLLAQSISEPDMMATAFAGLAIALQKAGDTVNARRALATALHVGPWQRTLDALSSVAPDALITIGRLLTDRHSGTAPPGQPDNTC